LFDLSEIVGFHDGLSDDSRGLDYIKIKKLVDEMFAGKGDRENDEKAPETEQLEEKKRLGLCDIHKSAPDPGCVEQVALHQIFPNGITPEKIRGQHRVDRWDRPQGLF
jgi:hypothetical protein